jgi:uncharacterized repeat protein (TIGR03803 family)
MSIIGSKSQHYSPRARMPGNRHLCRPRIEALERLSLLSTLSVVETVVHSFGGTVQNVLGTTQPDGVQPEGNVTLGLSGGVLYGRTFIGGTGTAMSNQGVGIIFQVNTDGTGYSVLHNFTGSDGSHGPVDGAFPRHNAMLLSADGTILYGMALEGGKKNDGVVFSYALNVSPSAAFTVIHSFEGSKHDDGSTPHGSVIFNGNGTSLIGMTEKGGQQDKGTLFQIDTTPGSVPQILHSFDQKNSGKPSKKDGEEPHGTPILSGYHLYGMTRKGGVKGSYGVIYDYDLKTGKYKLLHRFQGPTSDGATPFHGTVLKLHHTLYGMTTNGGKFQSGGVGDGVIFRYDLKSGHYKVLHNFSGGNGQKGSKLDGAQPDGSLTRVGKHLYGVTTLGGQFGQGTLFRMDKSGKHFRVLYSFGGTPSDGRHPVDSLTPLVVDGHHLTFFGMTQKGGEHGAGTIFAVQVSTR